MRQAFADLAPDVQRLPALGLVFPELAFDTPGRRFGEIEVLEALVALVADRGPVVLVLDDLHWADTSTLAALAYLRRRASGRGVALVTAALPPTPSYEDQLRRLAPDTIVRLEALTAAELAPLGMPDLHEATDGHPHAVADAVAGGGPASPSGTLAEALLRQCRAEGPEA
jgi:AAA ATPase domain